jgi:hypothetical protein
MDKWLTPNLSIDFISLRLTCAVVLCKAPQVSPCPPWCSFWLQPPSRTTPLTAMLDRAHFLAKGHLSGPPKPDTLPNT